MRQLAICSLLILLSAASLLLMVGLARDAARAAREWRYWE